MGQIQSGNRRKNRKNNILIPVDGDYLGLKHEAQIMNKLNYDEELVFSAEVMKKNRYSLWQNRNILLTTKKITNVKEFNFQRSVPVIRIKALTKAQEKEHHEFILHFRDEYDYFMKCDKKDELFQAIKECFFKETGKNLPIFGVPAAQIESFATTKKDVSKGDVKLPDQSFQITSEDQFEEEEIKTEQQEEEEEKMSTEAQQLFAQKGDTAVVLDDFDIKAVIGRGAFGKVQVVQNRKTQEVLAMKSLKKHRIIETKSLEKAELEQKILQQIQHPCLVNMRYVFQTNLRIYFLMRLYRGGDLFSYLSEGHFSEDRARFYAVQVVLALGHLHSKNIVYRDLKPENIVMDDDGYVCLTDFGIAKELKDGESAHSVQGSPDYLAPEVLDRSGHSYPADWWTLGILTYEMIIGAPPFNSISNDRKKMYDRICKGRVWFPNTEEAKFHGIEMSDECKDFIVSLMTKDVGARLGTTGDMQEVLAHPWLKSVDHQKILSRQVDAPMKPKLSANPLDTNNFDSEFTDQATEETHIPEKKQQIAFTNEEEFKGFDKKTGK